MSDQQSFPFMPRRNGRRRRPDSVSFDSEASRNRKKAGMDLAAQNRAHLLEYARDVAEMIALSNSFRTCTADEVQQALIANGYKPKQLGNAAGSLFKNGQWEFLDWMKSRRVSNHCRLIGIWRLKESA